MGEGGGEGGLCREESRLLFPVHLEPFIGLVMALERCQEEIEFVAYFKPPEKLSPVHTRQGGTKQ